jgi:hypothetical protein
MEKAVLLLPSISPKFELPSRRPKYDQVISSKLRDSGGRGADRGVFVASDTLPSKQTETGAHLIQIHIH